MNKVSDFKIAESIIRKICTKHNVNFVDISISFDEDVSGSLLVGKTKNIAHTIFKIVAEYINKSSEIVGIELMPDLPNKDEFFLVLASNLRTIMYGESADNVHVDDPHAMRLYQHPLVWILLKDLIFPINNKKLVNLKIVCDGNAEVDIAKYYRQEDMPVEWSSEEPFIFVNIINNNVLQSAFIFIESLRAFGLSPIEVIKNIYDSDMYDKFKGLLDMAYDEEEIYDFECAIMENLGVNFYNMISHKAACLHPNIVKTAQNSVPGLPNQLWQLGILEQMIEPTRGSDWEVYKSLEPYVKEFWDKVEDVRKKRIENGHDDGVPFNTLLRLKQHQTVGYKTDTSKTLQSLLSSDRVW